jgi:hypothetical protein
VFALLFLYQYIAAAVLGYVMVGRSGRWVTAFLLFLFALAVVFVIDIDRPVGGAFKESQEPMLWLQALRLRRHGMIGCQQPGKPKASRSILVLPKIIYARPHRRPSVALAVWRAWGPTAMRFGCRPKPKPLAIAKLTYVKVSVSRRRLDGLP